MKYKTTARVNIAKSENNNHLVAVGVRIKKLKLQ